MNPEISVVMPALNEEANIRAAAAAVLAAFDRFGAAGELVVVDDGSRDRTGELVRELQTFDPRVNLMRHPEPLGIGASFWDGVSVARGELVVMMPGDGENEPAEMLRYLALGREVDLVVPFIYNRQVRSTARNRISSLYRWIINVSFRVNFRYTNGTVLYRRSVLRDLELRSRGFFYQTELLVKLVRRGYLYAEVPCRLGARSTGRSKALTLASLRKVAAGYLALMREVYFRGAGPAPEPVPDSATGRRAREAALRKE
ncbi:MAG TPA: glycosyltransferase family 2 protein [bacterium]|nr:glycosyltransferase family 2 protein [bacterium]HNS47973.1 glycosyltransferase family 2 protein [bacterium]